MDGGLTMARDYWMSWDARPDRRPRLSRRALLRLGFALLALLLLLLVVLLIILGHETRSSGGGVGGSSKIAMAFHAAYAFVLPDFMPGAGFPGLPDLSRIVFDFVFGCSFWLRVVALAAFIGGMVVAYRLGRKRGRDDAETRAVLGG